MSLESLKAAFGITAQVVRERVLGYDGKPHFFRELTAHEVETTWDIRDAKGEVIPEKAKGIDYRVLAAIVCDKDGNALGTPEDFRELPSKLKVELTNVAMDVNGMRAKEDTKGDDKKGDDKPKN